MTETTFRSYEVHKHELLTSVKVNNPRAKLPDHLLPKQVKLDATWVSRSGARLFSWFAMGTDVSITISLPVVPGDGSQDLQQLMDWLAINGYRQTSDPDDLDIIYQRQN